MTIQSGLNNLIVTITQKSIGNFSDIMRNAEMNPANKLNPMDLVQIMGVVHSVPKSVTEKAMTADGILPNDLICFRYTVVGSYKIHPEKDTPVYKNLFFYLGKEYWKVNIHEAFFLIREGAIIMLNDYVMVEDIAEKSAIILPNYMKKFVNAGVATLTNIGKGEQIPEGARIYFHPHKLQNYQIKGKKFGILKQKDIMGYEI